jgi:chaperonin GroES
MKINTKENKMKLHPLGNRIVILPYKSKGTTEGGIIIPDKAQEKPLIGVVKAVGPGKVMEDGSFLKPTLITGQIVAFPKFGGTVMEIEGIEYRIIGEEEVLATVSMDITEEKND